MDEAFLLVGAETRVCLSVCWSSQLIDKHGACSWASWVLLGAGSCLLLLRILTLYLALNLIFPLCFKVVQVTVLGSPTLLGWSKSNCCSGVMFTVSFFAPQSAPVWRIICKVSYPSLITPLTQFPSEFSQLWPFFLINKK